VVPAMAFCNYGEFCIAKVGNFALQFRGIILCNKQHIINVSNVDYGEPKVSPHTGKQLEILSFRLQVIGETQKNTLENALSKAKNGGIFNIDNNGITIREYRLVNHFFSYTGNNTDEDTVYTYTLRLEEVEELAIDSLVIAGFEVVPYEFNESYDDAIIINSKIKLSKEDAEKLDMATKENIYLDVIRKGISDEVKKMRFGKVIWSENDGYIKKDIVLVEDVYDNKESSISKFFEPEFSNIMNILAYVYNLNEELFKLLMSKGQLSTEELEQTKEMAKNNIRETTKKYYRVEDIDKF